MDLEAEEKNKTPKQGTINYQAPATRGKRKPNPGWPGLCFKNSNNLLQK